MKPDRRAFVLGSSHALLAAASAAVTSRAMAQLAQEPESKPLGLPAGATSRFATVNSVRLHLVEMGSGPVVLLLHGWPQTWYAWREHMPALAQQFRVIAPDMRGSGLSERTKAGYDKRTIADDLRGLIAHAGVSKAHVVGHDMGGKAAYVLAQLYPTTVEKLVLVDCLLPGTENMDALRGGAWHYGFHMAPDVPELLTKGRERDYIRTQIKAWSRKKDAIGEAAITEYASHYARPGGMTAGFNYYRALREDAPFVATLRGRRLPMPVLTIAGRYGVGDKLAASLRDEAGSLTSIVAEDSGHFVAEEVPEFFRQKLTEFLTA
jgi:pimeloyl-ACP methyl ester carboxylesterase